MIALYTQRCLARAVWRAGGRVLGDARLSSPDQHSVLLIQRDVLGVDEFVLRRVKIRGVEVEPDFQGPVRHPPLSLEEVAGLG
jgi:hypothetical protein